MTNEEVLPLKLNFIKNMILNSKFLKMTIEEGYFNDLFDYLIELSKDEKKISAVTKAQLPSITNILGSYATSDEEITDPENEGQKVILSHYIARRLITLLEASPNTTLIEKVFIPLLMSSQNSSICVRPDSKSLEKSKLEFKVSAPKKQPLKTNLIIDAHHSKMYEALDSLVDPLTKKLIKDGTWTKKLTTSSDNGDFVNNFKNNVCGNGEGLLLLINGQSLGQELTLGVFARKNFPAIGTSTTG